MTKWAFVIGDGLGCSEQHLRCRVAWTGLALADAIEQCPTAVGDRMWVETETILAGSGKSERLLGRRLSGFPAPVFYDRDPNRVAKCVGNLQKKPLRKNLVHHTSASWPCEPVHPPLVMESKLVLLQS